MLLTKYDVFLKVLELGSFSRAAKDLGYTQSTVSHSISQLESEFGFKLLVRERQGLTLTGEGEEILPFVQEMTVCERKLEAKLAEINGVVKGTVNIGTYHTISYNWMPLIIKEFNVLYPGVNINHFHGNAIILKELLISGRVDCCIMDILPDETYESIPLYKEKYKVIIPKNHPDRDRPEFEASKLDPEGIEYVKAGKGLILFSEDRDGAADDNINSYTTDENVLLSMVERGTGVGLIAEMALRRNPFHVLAKDADIPLFREIGLVIKDRNKLSPAARAFIDHVRTNDYYMKPDSDRGTAE